MDAKVLFTPMLLGRRGPQLPNRLRLAFKTTEPLATTFLVQFLHLEMAMSSIIHRLRGLQTKV